MAISPISPPNLISMEIGLSGMHPGRLSDLHLTLQANQASNKVAWCVLPHSEIWGGQLFPAHAAEGFPFILGVSLFVPAVCTSSCLSLVEKEAPFTASQLTPACIPQIDADWKRTSSLDYLSSSCSHSSRNGHVKEGVSLLLIPLPLHPLESPLSVHWNSMSAEMSASECASKAAS